MTGRAAALLWGERQGELRYFLLLLALSAAVRCPTLAAPPFNVDETIYTAVATEILDGQLLYRDVVDHKPPGIFCIYAAIHGAAGRYNLAALHLTLFLVVALTGLLLARLGARVAGPDRRVGRLAGLLYVIVGASGPPMDFQAANAELFMNLPLVGALLVYVIARQRDRASGYLWAGLLLACAALIKLQAAYVAPAILLHALATRGRRWPLLLGLAGLVLPPAALLLCYWRLGALDDLLWAARYNALYVGAQTLATGSRRALERGAIFLALDAVLVVPALAQLVRRRDVPGDSRLLLAAWSLVSLLAVATGGRYFLHYFIQLVPPLALTAAPRLLAWGVRRVVRGAVVTIVLLAASAWVAVAFLDRQLRPREAWHQDRYAAVGRHVREHSAPDERIFVWGDSPAIYLQARRRLGARYLWVNYQLGRIWGTPADETDAPAHPELSSPETWPRLLQDLERRRPALIIDAAAGGLDELDRHPLTRYPEVARLVKRDYRLEARVLGVPIYRRKGR